ncbi:hypothetical protein KCP71_15520 [Salmonella enterica subsp. enterica]|nr:hypothetical protein KCP71_15520 [Salmonella enterica subsp. enterica]
MSPSAAFNISSGSHGQNSAAIPRQRRAALLLSHYTARFSCCTVPRCTGRHRQTSPAQHGTCETTKRCLRFSP